MLARVGGMFRLSISRVLRFGLAIAVIYMMANFAARFLFTTPDLITPGRGLPQRQRLKLSGAYPVTPRPVATLQNISPHVQEPPSRMSHDAKQDLVNYMGRHLAVKYEVTNNLIEDFKFIGRITFANTGSQPIPPGPWRVYFYHPVDIEGVRNDEIGAELANRMMFVTHVNGGLFKLQPTGLFTGIDPGHSLRIPFQGGRWMCSKTDIYPNWYVSARGVKPAAIESTAGESLSFVGNFDSEPLYKRNNRDNHSPFTHKKRFMRNEIEDMGRPGGYIVPTPLQIIAKDSKAKISVDNWVIVASRMMQNEASYVAEKAGMKEVQFKPKSKYIALVDGTVELPGADVVMQEAYSLVVDPDSESVTITGPTPTGIFNGIQSLLSLLSEAKTLPVVKILDAPRYGYRGFMLDVGRNFRPKKEVMEIIDLMSSYKMNKFHFHLTEDEGWRIEIPDLPELTLVASKRCHDLSEEECLLPFNGAGLSGHADGYYSVRDYKEILQFAKSRHVEVIPEIDVPGHAHAAIKAMQIRHKKLNHRGRTAQAEEFLLSDPDDQSRYHSVQQFKDNVINVCMDSTYKFIDQVMVTLTELHKDIQPLTTLHIGGDEVPRQALLDSPRCKDFMRKKNFVSQTNITHYFTQRVFELAAKHALKVQGWEDVFYKHQVLQHYKGVGDTTVNVWANVWTGGNVFRAHNLANNDYKVVLGPATHLYLDHPHEPHPDERGLFWATRFVDTYKIFGFMPSSFYDNIDITGYGEPLTKQDVCAEKAGGTAGKKAETCPKLKKPQNVIGIEAHLWSETVRTEEHLHTMIFPRLLAVAERAWHRANWELEPNANTRQRKKNEDWNRFANTLGYHELPRLEKRGIKYHIPVPGALIEDGKLKMNAAIPGLPFVASSNGGVTWFTLATNNRISGKTLLATSSLDGKRRSRSIEVNIR